MVEIIGVSFKKNSKVYYFSPNGLIVSKGDNVIVETERGLQFGVVEISNTQIEESKLKNPLNNLIRICNSNDIKINEKNLLDASKALKKCKMLVEKNNLNMVILDASYTFDRKQLLFVFLADNRVDFRNLAKELASIYKTRIELRQVGVRDKAKELGGYGSCGRSLCCSKFLCDFDSVSINMAKNQNIALNPNKINGVCGRLLCCLKYEDECYKELSKNLPKVGKKIETEFGEGKVISVDILAQKYKVDVKEHGIVEVDLNESN